MNPAVRGGRRPRPDRGLCGSNASSDLRPPAAPAPHLTLGRELHRGDQERGPSRFGAGGGRAPRRPARRTGAATRAPDASARSSGGCHRVAAGDEPIEALARDPHAPGRFRDPTRAHGVDRANRDRRGRRNVAADRRRADGAAAARAAGSRRWRGGDGRIDRVPREPLDARFSLPARGAASRPTPRVAYMCGRGDWIRTNTQPARGSQGREGRGARVQIRTSRRSGTGSGLGVSAPLFKGGAMSPLLRLRFALRARFAYLPTRSLAGRETKEAAGLPAASKKMVGATGFEPATS